MRRKELFYYVTWGLNVTRHVHWCVTVDYQQIANGNIANQIYGFTIDYGKFILITIIIYATYIHCFTYTTYNVRLQTDTYHIIYKKRGTYSEDLNNYKRQKG